MPQPTIAISYFGGTVAGASGAFSSSEIEGNCFWSITVGAATPDNLDIASGTDSLLNNSFPKDGNSEQQIAGIFGLTVVAVDTPLFFHMYQSHDDGDSVAITQAFSQEFSVTANTLIVSTDATGLNLSVNFNRDIGAGAFDPQFYFVIHTPALMDGAWADAIRNGRNKDYGPPLYASGALVPGPGLSFSLSAHDLAGIQAVLTEGVTYGIGVTASDARSIQHFVQPTNPVLTTTFVASFAAVATAAVGSVNGGDPINDGAVGIPFTYSGFSGDVISAQLLDSFGGTYQLANFVAGAGVGVVDGQDVVAIINSASADGVAFTAANNSLTFELTDGTDTATIPVIYNPAAGYAVTEHVAPVRTDLGSWFNGFTGTVLDFDQTYYPTLGNYIVYPDGEHEHDLISGSIVDGASYDQDVNRWIKHSPQIFNNSLPADTVIPVITLVGNDPITIDQNTAFLDPGATALDDVDGDITANINVTGAVDTSIIASYTLNYDVSDAALNSAVQVQRTVNVIAVEVIPEGPIPTAATNEPIDARIYILPGADDGEPFSLNPYNTNMIIVTEIIGSYSRDAVDLTSSVCELIDVNDTIVFGPFAMVQVNDDWIATIPFGTALPDPTYTLSVEADADTGSQGLWRIELTTADRAE